jgi:hypothetical protein
VPAVKKYKKYYLSTMGFYGASGRKLRASIKPGKNKIGKN